MESFMNKNMHACPGDVHSVPPSSARLGFDLDALGIHWLGVGVVSGRACNSCGLGPYSSVSGVGAR